MADALSLLTIIEKLFSIFGRIQKGEIKRDEQVDNALHALNEALCETKAYVTSLNEGGERDRKHEHKLSKLWRDASVPLRHFDVDFAQRCFDKGSYWLEPDSWTRTQIQESRIALDQVHKSIQELLLV